MTDADSIDTTDVRGSCCWCAGSLRPSHYVQAVGADALTFCTEDCLRAKLHDDAAARASWQRRRWKRLTIVTVFIGACITPHDGPPSLHHPRAAQRSAPSPAAPLPGSFGPEWPPSEASLIDELGRDAWLHPLPGPFRRMPSRDSRVFGAERPGDRPIDCRKGHCGVDLGGEIWGEQVRAAHDGVVDRVQRAPNELRGGHYVRIAHRNGTVFTQYFHLAAIARWVEPGMPVKAGDVIGLLGDSGVKESTAHLHFTVSVRPAPDWPERYIDPEPLIALWPLRIPLESSHVVLVSTAGPPGLPLGGAPVDATTGALVAAPRKHGPQAKKSHKRLPAPSHDDGAAEAPPAADDEPAAEPSE
jgi:murein DD-endopeptidase MepM/ murein hydrolase activator NlpD